MPRYKYRLEKTMKDLNNMMINSLASTSKNVYIFYYVKTIDENKVTHAVNLTKLGKQIKLCDKTILKAIRQLHSEGFVNWDPIERILSISTLKREINERKKKNGINSTSN